MRLATSSGLVAEPPPVATAARGERSLELAGVRSRWRFRDAPQRALDGFDGLFRGFVTGTTRTAVDISVHVEGIDPGARPTVAMADPRLDPVRRHLRDVARRFPARADPERHAECQARELFAQSGPGLADELERFADMGENAVLVSAGGDPLFVYPGLGEARLFLRPRPRSVARTLRLAGYFVHGVLLPRLGGLLLHAAAIRSERAAHVFMGVSGSGKTTIAGLLRQVGVLADDAAALRVENGAFRVFPTPWHGVCGLPADGPPLGRRSFELGRLFVLEQGPRVRFERVAPERALAAALRSFVHCARFVDGGSLTSAVALARRLFDVVPCYRMHFTRSSDFWPRIAELARV